MRATSTQTLMLEFAYSPGVLISMHQEDSHVSQKSPSGKISTAFATFLKLTRILLKSLKRVIAKLHLQLSEPPEVKTG